MSFRTVRSDGERGEDGRKPGEPHPDSEENLNYALRKLKGLSYVKGMEIVYSDIDENNVIVKPIAVTFYWTDGIRKYGHPISFHQSTEKFREDLDKFLGDKHRS